MLGLSTRISLRQWYAGQALAGMLANPSLWDQVNPQVYPWFSNQAFLFADAMLRQESEPTK